ncbi:MAG TPA: queuosine salvage family protein [Baekduia sp.]|nr:queuosine salvage family protein [Baekduia sp.]
MADLTDEVRDTCAAIAADARSVRIDQDALFALTVGTDVPAPALDAERHYLEGSPQDVATYLLTLDAVNFGSGWFPTLRKRTDPATGRPVSGYFTVAWALTDRFRAHGPWSTAELRAMRAAELADVLGQPRDHELTALYAQALRELGRFLGDRGALDVVAQAGASAPRLAGMLASSMTLWADRGFYKRAQILAHDLALAGVATFGDLDRLTIFADNLVPHVLRCCGVLHYDADLAARIDAGELLPAGREEREIRACAVHACELLSARTGIPARVLDVWLWNRGQAPEIKARPRHRTRCVFY